MTCDLCVIRDICRARQVVSDNWVIRHVTEYKFHENCKYYIKDDIKELSLPNIDIIEKEVIE